MTCVSINRYAFGSSGVAITIIISANEATEEVIKKAVMYFRALSYISSLFLSSIYAAKASTITWIAKKNNMMRIDSESMRKQILVSLCKGSTFFVIVQVYVVFYTKYCRYETHKMEGSMSAIMEKSWFGGC